MNSNLAYQNLAYEATFDPSLGLLHSTLDSLAHLSFAFVSLLH